MSATDRDERRPPNAQAELTLDPGEWNASRALGHRILDDMIDFLATLREQPPWRAPTDAARREFDAGLPLNGQAAADVYDRVRKHVVPHAIGSVHPRFWGWVNGSGSVTGMFADMIASGLNSYVAFGDQSPIYMELQVIRWFAELLGMPTESSGVLVSSGSMANLIGLTVARDTMLPGALADGLSATGIIPRIYASDQIHSSVEKAVGVLGLGRRNLRRVPSGPDSRIDIGALKDTIVADRVAGLKPICIVAAAGTVSTGAFDDIAALADVAALEKVWLHVDGAFGATVATSSRHRHLLRGLERADSIAFDLHKWFHVPYDVGCAMVRDRTAHHRSFSVPASYLSSMERGVAARWHSFGEYGVDYSRGFRALKVWMCLQEHGIEKFGALVEQNIQQASYLAELISRRPELELLAPVTLHIVCFRHRPAGVSDPRALDEHNRQIIMELHERGIAVPSFTRIGGAFAIRVSLTNHRTRREDLEMLVDAVCSIGGELSMHRD